MDEGRRYHWRPAALRGERTVVLTEAGFAIDGQPVLPWSEVETVGFALDRARRVTMMTLRLRVDGQDLRLSVTGEGPEVARYVEMLRALTGALAAAQPGMTIAIGHEGGARWGMFLVGLAGGLVGLGLVVLGILLGLEGDVGGGLGMGFVGGVAGLGCAAIALSNLPGAARPESPLAEFHAGLGLPDS
ncbi:hypothetical protein HKCCSP123_06670 [Rhodobacterales bacterium HKCCSP123]|nr:hypothetical protein [Rhodobacterales bacterium HKCCSP123]